MEVGSHFVPFEGTVTVAGGKLLAVSPTAIAAVFSQHDKTNWQVLCLPLANNRIIKVFEEDAVQALEDLGLSQFADSWYLDLEKDLG